jgi:hypothetical protein
MSSAPTNTNKGAKPRTFSIGLLPCRFELPRIQIWNHSDRRAGPLMRDAQPPLGDLAISGPCLAHINSLFSEATKGTATGFRRTIHYFVEHQIVASKVTFANQSGSPGVPDPVVRISTSSLRFEGHTLVGSQDQRRDSEGWRNGSIPYSNSPQGRVCSTRFPSPFATRKRRPRSLPG